MTDSHLPGCGRCEKYVEVISQALTLIALGRTADASALLHGPVQEHNLRVGKRLTTLREQMAEAFLTEHFDEGQA